ncbi:PREDICTED: activating signal cointegrator 1 complex subunit 2 homolog [Tarenaya hassleriana]|uniref:activating signal cointegrator 1 complex subunit 2 homolog n=1 Tax=Tarenaya hassleriana TaxID=28532 RepID=UPI00053C14B0|nr:PREDICTED: activating signal cointegrator 1 complex subunit 2 homolog [Tarenaya hassleriana]
MNRDDPDVVGDRRAYNNLTAEEKMEINSRLRRIFRRNDPPLSVFFSIYFRIKHVIRECIRRGMTQEQTLAYMQNKFRGLSPVYTRIFWTSLHQPIARTAESPDEELSLITLRMSNEHTTDARGQVPNEQRRLLRLTELTCRMQERLLQRQTQEPQVPSPFLATMPENPSPASAPGGNAQRTHRPSYSQQQQQQDGVGAMNLQHGAIPYVMQSEARAYHRPAQRPRLSGPTPIQERQPQPQPQASDHGHGTSHQQDEQQQEGSGESLTSN